MEQTPKIKTDHLIVLDYSTGRIHHYRVAKDKEVNEDLIVQLGFKLSQVSWMHSHSEHYQEITHKGILV